MLKFMAGQDFDLSDAAGAVWKIGAGVALIMGLGALVRREPPEQNVVVTTEERSYRRDSLTGQVTVPVRIGVKRGNMWLQGCPPPVIWVQRETPEGWLRDREVNHFCNSGEKGQVLLINRDAPHTVPLTFDTPGRYKLAAPRGVNWKWSREITIR